MPSLCQHCGRLCVGSIPLFAALAEDEILKLQDLVTYHPVKKGEHVIRQADPLESLFIIHEGQARIYRLAPDGTEKTLRVAGQGEFFGETALLSGSKASFSALMVSPGLICKIDRNTLTSFLLSHPATMYAILTALVERTVNSERILENLSRYDSRQKSAALLLMLAGTNGCRRGAATEVRLPGNRSELASMVGLAQETLSRRLAEFRAEGLVLPRGYRRLLIRDEGSLKKMLEDI